MPMEPGGPAIPGTARGDVALDVEQEVARDIQDVQKQREHDEARRLGKEGGCGHQLCDCREPAVERGGQEFCSDRCADLELGGPADMKCSCSHAECIPA